MIDKEENPTQDDLGQRQYTPYNIYKNYQTYKTHNDKFAAKIGADWVIRKYYDTLKLEIDLHSNVGLKCIYVRSWDFAVCKPEIVYIIKVEAGGKLLDTGRRHLEAGHVFLYNDGAFTELDSIAGRNFELNRQFKEVLNGNIPLNQQTFDSIFSK